MTVAGGMMNYGFKEMLTEFQASGRVADERGAEVHRITKVALADAVAKFNDPTIENLFRIMGEPKLIIGPDEPPIFIEIGWLQRRADGEDVDEESLGDRQDKDALLKLEAFIARYLQDRLGLASNQIRIFIDPGLFKA